MQLDFFQDISRGRHNPESQKAFEQIKPIIKNQRERVYDLIDGNRCTLEIAEKIEVPLHKISGRFTELKIKERISKTHTKEYKNSTYAVYKPLEQIE